MSRRAFRSEAEEVSEEEARRRKDATESILDFTTYTKGDYAVRPFHKAIARFIDRVMSGECKRGMIFAPPRHGKSELISRRLPAYYLGNNPTHHIIACSYSSGLASRMNRDVQRIIDGDAYKRLFPGVGLYGKNIRTVAHGSWLRNNELFEIVGHAGSYRAAGVGGGVTGMGANLILLDDYLKNAAEARSDTIRESQWEWFSQDVYTRQAPGCAILIICTRWHHDDIPGRLLKAWEEGEGEPWEVLRIPAIAGTSAAFDGDDRSEGDALWPERYGLDYLHRARQQLGPRPFGALYQQEPTPREGGLFHEGSFKTIPAAPSRDQIKHLIRWWDKGYSAEGDYTAGPLVALLHDYRIVVLDMVRGQWAPNERNRTIVQTAHADRAAYGYVKTLIERPPGAGAETTATLVKALMGFPVEPRQPRTSKEERAEVLSDQCDAGNVYVVQAPWNRALVQEGITFPAGENDDQIDAVTGAVEEFALYMPDYTTPSSLPNPAREPIATPPPPQPPDRDRAYTEGDAGAHGRRDEGDDRPRRRYFGRDRGR